MTSSKLNFNNSKSRQAGQSTAVKNYSLPEVIEALTPLFIAFIGALIGVVVLIQPMGRIDDTRATAGLGLAGTAIAGAAGLARTSRSEQDFSVNKQVENSADNN